MTSPAASVFFSPLIPTRLGTAGLADEMEQALRDNADVLTQLEIFNVTSRTPVLTGALASDIDGDSNLEPNQLSYVFFGEQEQLDEYGRVYALYQEGGVLGLSTYTNAPHEMIARAVTEDIPDIQTWGQQTLAGFALWVLAYQ